MRVLYASHFGGMGGAERSLLDLMLAVRTLGIQPLLLCPEGPLSRQAAKNGIASEHWPVHTVTRALGSRPWWRSAPEVMSGWWKLNRQLERLQPDIFHVNSSQAMFWAGPAGWIRRSCPVVWHWRDFHQSGSSARLMARTASAVVAISRCVREFVAARLDGTVRVALVENGVADLGPDIPARGAKQRAALGVPSGVPLIVMAGQSVPRKGHAVFLQALARLRRQRPDARAWLLCMEHDRQSAEHTRGLRRQAAELGCGENVRITTGVDEIGPVLSAADVVAVPSLREPFGRIAVEAMLAERPVVASDVDGLREIVVEGETGILVRPSDAAGFAEGLLHVLEQPDLWRSKMPSARRRALTLYSSARVGTEIRALYKELAGSRG